MHHIKTEDLKIGAVERHHEQPVSWHGLESVRENLSVANCGLREINVQVGEINMGTQVTPWAAPYIMNPLTQEEFDNVDEDEKEERGDEEYSPVLFLSKPFDRKSYELFTPAQMVDFAGLCFKEAGLDDSIAFTTTLFRGRRQTIAKEITEASFKDGNKHEVKSYINLCNSVDGSWKFFVNISEIRTVCFNTASANIGIGGTSCKHRPDAMAAFLKRFPAIFAQALKDHKSSANDYLRLAGIEMTLEQAQRFFAALLVKGEDDAKLSRVAYNRVEGDLSSLFVKGKGNYGVSAADAYNAVTEYYTHNYSEEANAPGGTADNCKRNAKEMLLSDKLPATLERGKQLLMDVK
jgi:hypothetical protein